MLPPFSLASRLRTKRQGADAKPFLIGWSSYAGPILEAYATTGVDGVLIDTQHGVPSFEEVRAGIAGIVRAGVPALVRAPVGAFGDVSRYLDLGASGIIAPMINSVDEARAFADAAKYPPMGARSWGPMRTSLLHGLDPATSLKHANAETVTFAMIETPQALACLDGILALDGIDGVFVGPNDLALTLTGGDNTNYSAPEVAQVIAGIARSARKAGKFSGIFGGNIPSIRSFAAMGFDMISLLTDGIALRAGVAQAFRDLDAT